MSPWSFCRQYQFTQLPQAEIRESHQVKLDREVVQHEEREVARRKTSTKRRNKL